MAKAAFPSFKARLSALVLVITDAIDGPPFRLRITSVLTAPFLTLATVPAKMFLALSFMGYSSFC
jgi:hypothetical protein